MVCKKILLVDDDIDNREIFIEAINSLNKNIICHAKADSKKSFGELKNDKVAPDFTFLDLNMPVLNGFEFFQQMRRIGHLKHLPVIFYSSFPQEAIASIYQKNHTAQYISKPYSYGDLVAILMRFINFLKLLIYLS